jgi:hypothetical protein
LKQLGEKLIRAGKKETLSALSSIELLGLYARIIEELRARGITRSSNSPTGDLAEFLFCKAFKWSQSESSNANVDAVANDGTRYQIKGRRLTRHNKSRQLSAIRDFKGRHFDFLAATLFTEEFDVLRAAIIPYSIVKKLAKFVERTNSHKFILREEVWHAPGVQDVTLRLRAVSLQ